MVSSPLSDPRLTGSAPVQYLERHFVPRLISPSQFQSEWTRQFGRLTPHLLGALMLSEPGRDRVIPHSRRQLLPIVQPCRSLNNGARLIFSCVVTYNPSGRRSLPLTKVRVGLHLASCADCRAYVRQIALVRDATSLSPSSSLPDCSSAPASTLRRPSRASNRMLKQRFELDIVPPRQYNGPRKRDGRPARTRSEYRRGRLCPDSS